jgi:hypothetical protein
MAYIGKQPIVGNHILLDDISGSFNGSTTAFTLQSGAVNVVPQTEQSCIISISGVVQYPNDAYTISGSTITFTSAPLASDSFSGVVLGDTLNVGVPSDATITTSKLASSFYDKEARKASAKSKLEALGLTTEEIKEAFGI